jgi:hypothetical protein
MSKEALVLQTLLLGIALAAAGVSSVLGTCFLFDLGKSPRRYFRLRGER